MIEDLALFYNYFTEQYSRGSSSVQFVLISFNILRIELEAWKMKNPSNYYET